MFPEEKPRTVKKLVNTMVSEGTLEYWSSGSTTLIGLKGVGKQAHAEERRLINWDIHENGLGLGRLSCPER